jgi:hypothetical protein
MKTKFTMFRRGAMFYMQDSATGKQTSLRTKDEAEASSFPPPSKRHKQSLAFSVAGHRAACATCPFPCESDI